MTAPAWVALGAAVAVWPGRTAHARRPSVRHRSPQPGVPALAAAAGGAVAVLCVVVAGPVRGLLAAGAGVPIATVLVSRSLTRSRANGGIAGLPFTLDLAAAVLRGGAPVSVALEHAAPAAGQDVAPRLVQAARLLRLGAGPAEAWRLLDTDPRLATLAAVSRRSATSGVRLAAAWEQLATDLRAEQQAAALVRAHRAGVFAMAPLGLCFLPAFVCWGVVPDVLGIARDVVAGGV